MTTLDFDLERTLVIRARPQTVFRFFTDPERFARWWGKGSTIDPRPSGEVRIVYPNGVEAGGSVVEIEPGERIVFTFGYESGEPIPVGGSRVTVTVAGDPDGTRLHLRHELPDAASRDAHVPGWRYQLAVFANVAADDAHDVEAIVGRWLAAWSEPDGAARRRLLGEVVDDDVEFRDAWGCVRGVEELGAHVKAARMVMREARFELEGDCRHCQGTVLVDWTATAAGSDAPTRGSTVLELTPDGRVRSAVGFVAG